MATPKPVDMEKFLAEWQGKFIRYYFRDNAGRPIGIVVGLKIDNNVRVGYSICNTELDSYDKNFGLYVALKRAVKGIKIPDKRKIANLETIKESLHKMEERGKRYFKQTV